MSSPFDAAIAAAWGRWLEGEPEPTDEGVLAGGLRLPGDTLHSFAHQVADCQAGPYSPYAYGNPCSQYFSYLYIH